jgi:hypothetical protein
MEHIASRLIPQPPHLACKARSPGIWLPDIHFGARLGEGEVKLAQATFAPSPNRDAGEVEGAAQVRHGEARVTANAFDPVWNTGSVGRT